METPRNVVFQAPDFVETYTHAQELVLDAMFDGTRKQKLARAYIAACAEIERLMEKQKEDLMRATREADRADETALYWKRKYKSSLFTDKDAEWCDRIAVAFERNDAMDWDEVESVFKDMARRIRSNKLEESK